MIFGAEVCFFPRIEFLRVSHDRTSSRVTGPALVIAVASATPVLVTSARAAADTVVDGCTIVANPTPTNFTNCPGAQIQNASLSGTNLSYANLAGGVFEFTDLSGVDFSNANLSSTALSAANLSNANLSSANLTSASPATCFGFGEPVGRQPDQGPPPGRQLDQREPLGLQPDQGQPPGRQPGQCQLGHRYHLSGRHKRQQQPRRWDLYRSSGAPLTPALLHESWQGYETTGAK